MESIFLHSDVTMSTIAAVAAWGLTKLLGTIIVAKNRKLLFEKVGTVHELYYYPLKSSAAVQIPDAFCSEVGLNKYGATDRHWMTVAPDNSVVCMTEEPRLVLVKTRCEGDQLVISAPGMPDLRLPLQPDLRRAKTFIKVFDKQPIKVADCGEQAGQWMSQFLHTPVKMVYSCADLGTRCVYERERKWDTTSKSTDKTVFGYISSYLMMTTASLNDLNEKLEKPVDIVNFRPNIVVKSTVPFDEDNWTEIRIGNNVLFHYIEPCRRCIITTVDPQTGVRDKRTQPLRHLRSYRCRTPYGVCPVFGSYLSVDVPGHIQVGDPVYAIRKKEAVGGNS